MDAILLLFITINDPHTLDLLEDECIGWLQ